jgi:hypothetical protein
MAAGNFVLTDATLGDRIFLVSCLVIRSTLEALPDVRHLVIK